MQPQTGMSHQKRENQISFSKSGSRGCHSTCLHLASLWRYILALLKEAGDTWRAAPAFQSYPRQVQHPGSTEDAGTSQVLISQPRYKADARITPDPSALTNLRRGKALN